MNLPKLTAEQSLDAARGVYATKVSLGVSNQLDMAAAGGRPMCYNRRNCRGRVINRRDQHNCRRTGGNSWRPFPGGPCINN